MREPRISACGLCWNPGGARCIVGPVDLDVFAEESLVLIGPNGAGKTSLLRLLAGLVRPTAGELLLDGRPYAEVRRRDLARHVAYVPQAAPSNVPLTVEDVVLLGRFPYLSAFRLAPRASDFAAVESALQLVGIEDLRGRRVDLLSGGERQAVYIAAALAQEASILVLDEPTTHLDPRHQREIAAILPRLQKAGRTIVTATHDLHFASLVASRMIALRSGQVLASGTPERLVTPEILARLFDSPFEIVHSGERPVALLQLAR